MDSTLYPRRQFREDVVPWFWPLWLRRHRTGPLTEALTLALAADGDVRHALLELDLAAVVLREMHASHGEAAVLSTRADLLIQAGLETEARQTRAKARRLRRAAAPCAEHQDPEPGDAR